MKYFIIAGEASGDLHGSNLMAALKQVDSSAEFCFLGGDLMLAQGGTMVKHYREMAFMGFVNVLLNMRTVLQNMRECKRAIIDFRADVVILIDYPSFNLRMAKFVKKQTQTPVYYYISPKLWAWKTYRIKSIKKYIDQMYTIFPFETDFYASYHYSVHYVGNPTVDSISQFRDHKPKADFRETYQLDNRPIVALLAGSRKQEIDQCLPIMVSMSDKFLDFQFVVASAPGIDVDFYKPFLSDRVKMVQGNTYWLLDNAYAAIVNSGTATLEVGLLKVPQVVVYHVIGGRFASFLKKILIKTKYISLVNLVAETGVVQELVAHLFTVANVERELTQILRNKEYYYTIIAGYNVLETRLGEAGTAVRAAKAISKNLRE